MIPNPREEGYISGERGGDKDNPSPAVELGCQMFSVSSPDGGEWRGRDSRFG